MSQPSPAESTPEAPGKEPAAPPLGAGSSAPEELTSAGPAGTPQDLGGSRAARGGSGQDTPTALAGALHEVSNALTVVLGWLDTAERAGDPAKLRAALAVAREHARRGRNLARGAIGADDELSIGVRGAGALAEFAVMSVTPRADERRVTVRLTLDGEVQTALKEEAQALQVLTNLLLNALDFSAPGRSVRVSVRRDQSWACFCVHDQGPGVPDERRATLFEDAVSTRRGGAGIGLSFSRRLAREIGGELRLLPSETGALFELRWPTLRSEGESSRARDDAAGASAEVELSRLRGARILIVEDDPAIASLLELSLEARGAQVVVATTRAELTTLLEGRPVVDAVLLDLSPVKGHVAETVRALQNAAPQVAVLLVSGEPSGVPPEAQGCIASWVRKPFETSELLAALVRVLAPGGVTEPAQSHDRTP